MIKAKDLKEQKMDDLLKQLKDTREELRQVRFGSAGSKIRDTNRARKLRRDKARILTVIHQR